MDTDEEVSSRTKLQELVKLEKQMEVTIILLVLALGGLVAHFTWLRYKHHDSLSTLKWMISFYAQILLLLLFVLTIFVVISWNHSGGR